MITEHGREYSIGTHVKLHTQDTWNDMYGIVDDHIGNVIAVSCIALPLYRYYVSFDDAGNILELVG